MLHNKFVEIGPLVPEEKIFQGTIAFLLFLYHILAWRPSWSCDTDAVNKLSFYLPIESSHKIWL